MTAGVNHSILNTDVPCLELSSISYTSAASHLGGVTVGCVYHGEVCEEGPQVGDHTLD